MLRTLSGRVSLACCCAGGRATEGGEEQSRSQGSKAISRVRRNASDESIGCSYMAEEKGVLRTCSGSKPGSPGGQARPLPGADCVWRSWKKPSSEVGPLKGLSKKVFLILTGEGYSMSKNPNDIELAPQWESESVPVYDAEVEAWVSSSSPSGTLSCNFANFRPGGAPIAPGGHERISRSWKKPSRDAGMSDGLSKNVFLMTTGDRQSPPGRAGDGLEASEPSPRPPPAKRAKGVG